MCQVCCKERPATDLRHKKVRREELHITLHLHGAGSWSVDSCRTMSLEAFKDAHSICSHTTKTQKIGRKLIWKRWMRTQALIIVAALWRGLLQWWRKRIFIIAKVHKLKMKSWLWSNENSINYHSYGSNLNKKIKQKKTKLALNFSKKYL